MPAYIVRYTNEKGRVRKERMFAPDIAYLQGMMQRKRYWPLSIKMEERKSRTYKTKLGAQDLISILDQVEIQLDVNINIDDAFRNLVDEFPRGKPKFVISHISDEINSTGRVADACGQFPRIFPDHIRQMISVGESTGKLANAFHRLIEYFQSADALKNTIISASMYPAMIMVAMVAFVFVIFGFTVPTLMKVFIEIGVELPPMTRAIMAMSNFIKDNLVLLLICTAIAPFVMVWSFRSKLFRPLIDWCMVKMAVIGPITKDICIARFATNLGALYESEIPIVQGLTICSKIAGNAIYNRGITITREAVEQGRGISDGLKESKVFPNMVVLTVRIGEENGKLDESLKKIAAYHNRKARERVDRALKLFEPVMLVVLVVMVGMMAYALLTPMMSMVEQLSK
ncbi:type II secretory pathway component PulF [Ereboglobus sp. PH5-10]|uniref:type II secretion system F family protein n=1 Tax=Ereboglobus sp. PH5-10 TaxID=2940629 RepID=UPI002405A716|nr:type II secretion system F family protein [Ereboglobus sp. PH5-10]MDF9828338.1 type II secretory pathway component PulF [Ereboglobus sp. PH5-10]